MISSQRQFYDAVLQSITPIKPEESYQTIIEQAIRLTKGVYGSMFLYKNGRMERVYTSFPPLYQIKSQFRGDNVALYNKKKPLIKSGPQIEKSYPELREFHVGSELMVPIMINKTFLGTVSILSPKDIQFTDKEILILEKLTPFAAIALRNACLIAELRQALESRDFFISMASHELKTPLTTINMYTQLLRKKLENNNSPQSTWMHTLSSEINRLTMLVNDLLRVETIETGHMSYRWSTCSIQKIISRALTDFKLNYPHKVVVHDYLQLDQDSVLGDFDKLLQVVINILNNAAKFSPSDSEIAIIIKSYYRSIRIDIQDHGNGISKKDLQRIFEKYYRGKTQNSHAGMGLGLFLVKNIVENHNGKIQVRSKLHKGTTFSIFLPKLEPKE